MKRDQSSEMRQKRAEETAGTALCLVSDHAPRRSFDTAAGVRPQADFIAMLLAERNGMGEHRQRRRLSEARSAQAYAPSHCGSKPAFVREL